MEDDRHATAPPHAQEVYVDIDSMRKFIASLLAVADVSADIPQFLDGQNAEGQSVRLGARDFGDYRPLHAQYHELVERRFNEAMDLRNYLHMTARKLAWGLAQLVGEDVEIAADFNKKYLDGYRNQGLDPLRDGDHEEAPLGTRASPGDPTPSEQRDQALQDRYRNVPEA